jgi:alkylation response protein AidB-like acyl-CoA dehydrogenase
MRLNNLRMRVGRSAADDPGPIGSIFKLVWATSNQAMQGLAVELLGPEAELVPSRAAEGLWLKRYLRSLANSIEGGSSEILRNIVAERILGLGRPLAPKAKSARRPRTTKPGCSGNPRPRSAPRSSRPSAFAV